MTKKAFNPGDWKNPRKKEILRCAQDDSTDGQASNDENLTDEIERLAQTVEARKVDITGDYHQWLEIGFALKEALGEDGRSYFHRLSRFYPGYNEDETDKQYDKCMRSKGDGIQPRTLFYFAKLAGIQLRPERPVPEPKQSPTRGVEGFEGLRGKRMPTFSQDLKGKLPKILDEVACNANSDEDADLLILGSVVALSACLPHLSGVYGDRPVYPNLFLFRRHRIRRQGRLTLVGA